jgi:branched-chain amino acid transport system permease protein
MTHQLFKRLPPWILDLALLVFAIALPYFQFMDRSRMSVAVLAGVYIMLGLSLNIIVGYAGLFQLGHAAFFGLGAYTAATLSIEHHITILATIPVAAVVAGGAAILITKPILHLRGDYLCIVTIAFGEIFRIAVTNNAFGITGGPNGLVGTGRPEFPLPWLQPVPVIMLVIILALHLFMTRRSGPLLQWGGAGVLALGYYLPPLLLDANRLFVISICMGLVALIAGSLLRGQRMPVRQQFAALIVIVAAFAVFMTARSDALAASIDGNLDKYFKVQDPVKFAGIDFTLAAFKRDARPYYFLVLIFIVITIVGMRRLQNSRLGRAWLYVREDQLAAEAMGIDTTQIKLAAFVIGSAWAGVAGVLYASRFTVVAPENFNFLQSVIMFCIVVLGGSGSISGVLIGTLGMVVLPELMRDVAPTFLYQGTEPVLILGVILASYLYNARQRWQSAALESGAIAAACLVPPLLLDQPSLYAVGLLMALFAVILATWTRRHTSRPLPWIAGGLAVYAVAILIIGGSVGPDLEREISAFRIMNWRDGLMGVAMVAMMILRPAGIIPERRKGITVSTADQTPALVPMTAAPQR